MLLNKSINSTTKLFRINILTIVFFVSMIFSSSYAIAQTLETHNLEKLCTSSEIEKRNSCLTIIAVFVDGFSEGVAKGVVDTYGLDPEVFSLVKDLKMQEMAPRIAVISEKSVCIHGVQPIEIKETFLLFVIKNPGTRSDNYRKTLIRSIVEKFCN